MTNADHPLQRYKIGKKIGTGGMASVFLAHDTVLKRDVALKMVHPHLLHQQETLRRFSNEAQAIATLSHENIVRIFDFGETRSRPFIVMEYVEGITLEALIAREGTIPPFAVIEIALQILSGLACAHENGICHRDIKPGNIMIDIAGRLRITDFGIAYFVNAESVTMTGSFIGSPHYVSPEQVSNSPVRATTDIFSLGIVLYQCCTGCIPFNAETPHGVIHAILTEDPPDLQANNRPVLFCLAECIEWFLTKDPARRPGADEAAARLRKICTEETVAAGRERLSRFIADSPEERLREGEELFALYRKKACDAMAAHRPAEGFRSFEQASRFGTLSGEDEKLMKKMSRRKLIRGRIALAGTVVTGIVLVLVCIAGAVRSMRSGKVTEESDPQMDRITTAGDLRLPSPENGVIGPDTIPAVPAPVIENTENPLHPASDRTVYGREKKPGATLVREETVPAVTPSDSPADRQANHFPPAGFLRLLTNPPWVTIYIDGVERGMTPKVSVVPLACGRHILRLAKRQFSEWTDTVVVAAAETTLVRIRLLSLEEETRAP